MEMNDNARRSDRLRKKKNNNNKTLPVKSIVSGANTRMGQRLFRFRNMRIPHCVANQNEEQVGE
jgi:hypothetical protein